MMYARRFGDGPRFRPASLGAALAINGGVIAALLLAAPEVIRIIPEPPITIFTPTPEPSPPPPNPEPTSRVKPQPEPRPSPTAAPDKSLDELKEPVDTSKDIGLPDTGEIGGGGGGTTVLDPPRPPLPALIGASFDPRYSADIEPPYPDIARDAGTEGVVKLRITIGADGRVKRAEPLGGDPVFIRAAVRHVLARWRFKPATRGGVPEESSNVMSVRFRLDS